MKRSYVYNFKNPIRHFIDVDSIWTPTGISVEQLSWSQPVKFRIKKNDEKYRTLKIPNIVNFIAAYEHYKNVTNFTNIGGINPSHNRLSANLDTGDFVSGEYDRRLQEDLERLCTYDYLVRIDIAEYYGRIYTHHIDFYGCEGRFLTNMNSGNTNGLIMGNYLSLFFAEVHTKKISDELENEIHSSRIQCEFSYFSDDFYLFCNAADVEKAILCFDKALEKMDLQRNESKDERWTYETHNQHNVVARYWKRVIAQCNQAFKKTSANNKLVFLNQLIYRLSVLDEKFKKVFVNSFFKTKYFREMDLERYQVKAYDYHQLCFLFKLSPEAMLYAIDRFVDMSSFEKGKLAKFLKVRYEASLRKPYHDEQLYYYYSLNILGMDDIISQAREMVLDSENQVLISYYLKDGIFSGTDISRLKACIDETYWFQNYHLILFSSDLQADLENNIQRYLIPAKASKPIQRDLYLRFYNENIQAGKALIRDIPGVHSEIKDYLALKVNENEAVYELRKLEDGSEEMVEDE